MHTHAHIHIIYVCTSYISVPLYPLSKIVLYSLTTNSKAIPKGGRYICVYISVCVCVPLQRFGCFKRFPRGLFRDDEC